MKFNILTVFMIIAAFVLLMSVITTVIYRRISKLSEDEINDDESEIEQLREESFGRDEIGDLVVGFNRMETALAKQMRNVAAMTAEREKVKAELSVATKIQADMLPRDFPRSDKFSLYATMTPAKEVGGDFYDFFFIDDEHIGLVMADVSGKGVPAALFMVVAKTLIKNRALSGGSPAQILEDVNNQLCENNDAGLFVTVWFGILDTASNVLTVSNAGHEYPAFCRNDGSYELLEAEHLPPLAAMEDMEYENETIKMEQGDVIFLYTDGVPEAKAPDGERFGTDKMLEILTKYKERTLNEQLSELKGEIDRFTGTGDPFDDVTMLALKIK